VSAPDTRRAAFRDRDRLRRKNEPWRRWYNLKRWKVLRLEILARDGWTCQQTGALLTGTPNRAHSAVVDHVEPHRGDPVRFWNPANLQAVAKCWHDSEKQRREKEAARVDKRPGGWSNL